MEQLTIGKNTFFIPDTESPCDLWKSYHLQLLKAVGKENANMIWLLTWDKKGSVSCTTSADFNDWLNKQGMDVSSASTRAVADLSAIGGNFLGLGKTLSKALSIGTPVLFGAVAIAIILVLVNTARKSDVLDVAALHPMGAKVGQGLKLMK